MSLNTIGLDERELDGDEEVEPFDNSGVDCRGKVGSGEQLPSTDPERELIGVLGQELQFDTE